MLVLAFVAIQFVPYGRDHVNPPVGAEPTWDSPGTRTLAKQACFDCHSNETEWPAYSRVAPVSWLIATSPRGRSVDGLRSPRASTANRVLMQLSRQL